MTIPHYNTKVANNRSSTWNKKIIAGKLDAQLKPSNLRLLRIKKGISQAYLAQKLGIAVSSYGSIERGKRPIKNDRAHKLSKLLKSKKNFLFIPSKINNKLIAKIA